MSDTEFIHHEAGLAALIERLRGRAWIAVDSEFLTDRSFVPRLCLVQVASEDSVACVDVLQSMDLEPLWGILRDPAITKVFHAAENDLSVLQPSVGGVFGPVFDTQVAAALCGHGEMVGYGDLVKRLVGVELDKSLARTDWSRRPLPSKSVRYAADDVRYLRDVFAHLERELETNGRRAWADQEFADLVEPARYRADPAEAWRRVRGQSNLDARSLTLLRGLAEWRECEARSTNRPRRWVLSDDALCGIARRAPRSASELDRVRGFEPGRHGAHRDPVLALVKHGLDAAVDATDGAGSRPTTGALAHVLRGIVELAAAERDLPAGLLAGAAELFRCAGGERDLRLFRGWRREVVGERIERFLAGGAALRFEDEGPVLSLDEHLSN